MPTPENIEQSQASEDRRSGVDDRRLVLPLDPVTLGAWTVELREDGSLRVEATRKGAPKVMTWADASNSVNITTLKILQENAELTRPESESNPTDTNQ